MYEMMVYENISYFSLLSIYESNDYKHFFKFKGHAKYTNVHALFRRSIEYRNIPSDMYLPADSSSIPFTSIFNRK